MVADTNGARVKCTGTPKDVSCGHGTEYHDLPVDWKGGETGWGCSFPGCGCEDWNPPNENEGAGA